MPFATFLILLAAVVGVSVVAERKGWSKEIIALLLGAAVAPFHISAIAGVHITPEFVMEWLLPVLLMPAAFKIAFGELKQALHYVALLATLGVLVAAAVGTALFQFFLDLPTAVAALPAVALAATDPISVISLLKRLGAPHRLGLFFELEALFNDATAAVVFRTAALAGGLVGAGAHAAGGAAAEGLDPLAALTTFAVATGGGILYGVVVGHLGSAVHRLVDSPAAEVLLTIFIAFAAIFGEHFNFSGVIAVVTAALVLGNVGRTQGMSAQTRISVHHFWEAVEYGAVVLIFLLIGLELSREQILRYYPAGLLAIAVSVVMRGVSVYAVTWLYHRLSRDRIPFAFQHALTWGGLRGGVSLALVLTVHGEYAPVIQVMVYSVVLWNILVQGTSMSPLLRRLRLIQPRRFDQALRHLLLRYGLLRAQRERLDRAGYPAVFATGLSTRLDQDLGDVETHLGELLQRHPELLANVQRELDTQLAANALDYLEKAVTGDPENAAAAATFYPELYRRLHLDGTDH